MLKSQIKDNYVSNLIEAQLYGWDLMVDIFCRALLEGKQDFDKFRQNFVECFDPDSFSKSLNDKVPIVCIRLVFNFLRTSVGVAKRVAKDIKYYRSTAAFCTRNTTIHRYTLLAM